MKCCACGLDVAKSGFSGAQLKRSAARGRTCKACVYVAAVKEEDTRTAGEVWELFQACKLGKLSVVKRLTTRPGVDIDR